MVPEVRSIQVAPSKVVAIPPHFNPPRGPAPIPIGFLRQGTRFDIVDVPQCPIATEGINERLTTVRERVRAQQETYTRASTLLLRQASGEVTTDYDAVITETVGNLKLHFLARDFFQNNPFILPAFTRYVREQAAASGITDAVLGTGEGHYKKYYASHYTAVNEGVAMASGMAGGARALAAGLLHAVEHGRFGPASKLAGRTRRRLDVILAVETRMGDQVRGVTRALAEDPAVAQASMQLDAPGVPSSRS